MLLSVKNLLFDLGGVIIDVNSANTIELLHRFGYKDVKFDLENNSELIKLIENYELGLIDDLEFLGFILTRCSNNASLESVKNAWNAMINPIKKEIFNLLVHLKTQYKIFVLSNTNNLHYQVYNNDFIENTGIGIKNFFEYCFLSFEIKLRKPNPAIFNYVIEKANIKAQETLFIDDQLVNIETAKQLGFRTLHLKKDLISELINYLNIV